MMTTSTTSTKTTTAPSEATPSESRRKSDHPHGIKARGKHGEPWLYHVHEKPPHQFHPVHLTEDERNKYREEARRTNVEIWCRPKDGVGAGDMVAFTTLKPPEQAEPIADRICACVNEFAGVDDPSGVIDTLRKLLADLESGRCKPDSIRMRAARALLAKRKQGEEVP